MILQSDPGWAAARIGHVTASRVSDLLATVRNGYAASRKNYAAELVAERLTGAAGERFVNTAMQWGTDTEPFARAAYEFRYDVTCGPAAFVKHPTIEWAGASPDGFVGDDGLVEFKCPNTATHIETLLGGGIPEKYVLQMRWQMACAARSWCDFASFDPRLPEHMRLSVKRVEVDMAEQRRIEKEVAQFISEIDDTLAALQRKCAA